MDLKDRIDLMLEYVNEKDIDIVRDTIYKNVPIGVMLMGIKTNSNSGRVKYPEDQLSRLREQGLLDFKREKAIEKAKRLEAYVRENPRLWHSNKEFKKYMATIDNDKEKEKIVKTYTEIKNDYLYLKRRKDEGKLDVGIIEMLFQAGVGGRSFGYPEDTMLFAEKTGYSNRIAQIILSEFGGLNNFREEFIALMLDRDIKEHSEIIKIIKKANDIAKKNNIPQPFVQGFDMSQPNFKLSKDDIAFLGALDEEYGCFIIEEKIHDCINSLKSEFDREIIKKYFGLEGNTPVSLETISTEMNCSKSAIGDKVVRLKKSLKEQQNNYKPHISEQSRMKFIKRFFERNDIFADGIELSEEEEKELIQIYNMGLTEKRIENLKNASIMLKRLESGEEIPIEELNFSDNIYALLKRNEYDTLNKILEGFRTKSIYKVNGMGIKAIKKVQETLENFGVSFSEKKGAFSFEDRYIPSVLEKVFEGRLDTTDMQLENMIETLLLAGQLLKEEEEECIKLGQIFEKTKQEELKMIKIALKSEGIEL